MRSRGRIRLYSLGDLLDTSISVYRGAFTSFVCIAAVTILPVVLLSLVVSAVAAAIGGYDASFENGPEILRFLVPLLAFAGQAATGQRSPIGLGSIVLFVVAPLMQGALIHAASRRIVGATVSPRSAYRVALRRAWPLIGAELASTVLILVPVVPLVVGSVALLGGWLLFSLVQAYGNGPSGGVFMLFVAAVVALTLLIVPFLLVVVARLALIGQAAMLEKNGPWDCINRSWHLTAGSFWRVLGYLIAIGLLGGVISIVVPMMLTIPLSVVFGVRGWPTYTIEAVAGALASIVVAPFTAIATTLLYHDLRLRDEQLAQAFGEPTDELVSVS